ncbi:MAG TPA: hypothetical protein VGP76_05855 [Planctomycetaceae bacterium]|jgi:hypothetical protein|nr:hypothetical protein [Planctomycetaceae bacterium]
MSTKSSIAALVILTFFLVFYLFALATYHGAEPPVRLWFGTLGTVGLLGVLVYRWARG